MKCAVEELDNGMNEGVAGMVNRHCKSLTTLIAVGSVASVVACETLSPSARPLTAFLHTDSTQIEVHRSGFGYLADISFVYTNTTTKPVSRAGCGVTFPGLEKKVDGKWVAAYYPIYPACLSKPDFMIPSGGTFRGVLQFMAFEPGHQSGPELLVASVDGIYRLRWDFAQGADAEAPGARRVQSFSNEFQMVLK
jgi:hypothetical protein